MTDEELMGRCRRGDAAAFTELYERHRDRSLRHATGMLGDADAAGDVVQEAFLYVFRKAPEWEPRAKFTTLLYRVVSSLSVTELRRRKTRKAEPMHDDAAADPRSGPESAVAGVELAGRVREALAEMPEAYREALALRFFEDLPYEEIAEMLDVPLGTVKSRIHNGLELLKGHFQRKLRTSEPPAR
ncbi:MAG: sigma-70 family RNA polymerase sigma factor [Planctomycetes bacterium]|nr:sigma-70 family RNA polymerase sigma factor [Planctomycetota bacterium]